MQTFRMLVAGAITAGIVVTLVPTADASVSTASNAEQCTQLTLELPDLSALGSPAKFKKSEFKNAARALRSAAKGTPANVKAAIKTMADYFDKIGNADARTLRSNRSPRRHGQVHQGNDRLRQVPVEGLCLT